MDDHGKIIAQGEELDIRYMDLSSPSLVLTVLYNSLAYHYTIIAIVAGRIQLVDEGIIIEPTQADICILPQSCIIKPIEDGYAKFWLLRFTEDYLDKITYVANQRAVHLLKNGISQLIPDAETFKIIKKLLLLLYKFQNSDAANSHLIRVLTINLLLSCLSEISSANPVTLKTALNRKEQIAFDFLKLAGNHAKEHHNVGFYAGTLCMTKGNLTKIVRKVLSSPPKALIEDILIRLAKEQLDGSFTPIYLIAEELNFKSSSAFINFFRGRTNTTPNEYRNRKTR